MPVLNWIGKEAVVNHDKEVPFRLLKKIKSYSVGDSQNLIIKGDNLEGLKALMPYYIGKVKCIYIDPPYNTGNENWVYNDKVNSPKIKKWLGKVVGGEAQDLCRHDKWLCMMYPRLKLLRDLLSDDGAIFISIDNNEQAHLKCLMNEIFGEENFRNSIIVKRGTKNVQAQFDKIDSLTQGYEYVLFYTKNSNNKINNFYLKLNEMTSGSWNNHWRGTDRPTMRYNLFNLKPEKGQWRWSEERSKKAVLNYNKMIKEIGKRESEITQDEIDNWYTNKIEELKIEGIDLLRLSKNNKPEHYISPKIERMGTDLWIDINASNSHILKNLFEDKIFDTPKSLEIIRRIINFYCDKDSTILDSFAGSGTTGHAVLDLNKEDGGNRKFILIEMEDDIAKKITAERIKRAIEKYDYKDGFEYCELDKPLFDENGQIEETCDFNQFATYIYFTETQTNIDKKQIEKNFIGESGETEYYLIYKEKYKNVLDKKFLSKLRKTKNKKIIYADFCMVDEEYLKKFNIVFKQIPYEVKVY